MRKDKPGKLFRVGVPAHVYVIVAAQNERAAIRQAKAKEGFEIVRRRPGPVLLPRKMFKISLGKFVVGTDPMEEV